MANVEFSLQRLGLSARLVRTYLAMVNSSGLGVRELAAHLSLDGAEVRRQLDVLVIAGLVAPTDTPDAYQPLPPDQAVELLIERSQATIQERRAGIDSAREAVPLLVDTFVAARSEARPSDVDVEVIDDASVLRARMFQLSRATTRRAQVLCAGPALSPSETAASTRLDLDLLDRGVHLQAIVSVASLSTTHWADHVSDLARRGAEVRVHPAPPESLRTFDDTVCVLSRSSSAGALISHDADLASPAVSLFGTLWQASEPFGSPSKQALTPRQREVLNLLAQGLTDDMIARRMQLSNRSVGRLVAQLCEQLQASSRFAAGYLAGQRGWLD